MSKQSIDAKIAEYADYIVEQLESSWKKGNWKAPWSTKSLQHHNAASGHVYQGSNIMRLWAHRGLYCSPEAGTSWMTFKQAKELGGKVRRGSKGCPISICFIAEDDKTEDGKLCFRTAFVFNTSDIDGLPEPDQVQAEDKPLSERVKKAQDRILSAGAKVVFDSRTPAYYPSKDEIVMTDHKFFDQDTEEEYISTLLHEHIHWTGHKSRLDRLVLTADREKYAYEELVAEFGGSFLTGEMGFDRDKLRHIAYLESWIGMIRKDPKIIFDAAKEAQKAVSFLNKLMDKEDNGTD